MSCLPLVRLLRCVLPSLGILLATALVASAATVTVRVYNFDYSSNPKGQPAADPVIDLGDTVHWVWETGGHNVQTVAGTTESFKTVILPAGSTFDYTFNNPGTTVYFCVPHGSDLGNGKATGMWASVTATYPGDANLDFAVDLTDFGLLKDNFGTGSTRGEGDFDRDGKVDLTDFGLLKDNFGRGSAAAPEPATALLLLVGAAAGLLRGAATRARSSRGRAFCRGRSGDYRPPLAGGAPSSGKS